MNVDPKATKVLRDKDSNKTEQTANLSIFFMQILIDCNNVSNSIC